MKKLSTKVFSITCILVLFCAYAMPLFASDSAFSTSSGISDSSVVLSEPSSIDWDILKSFFTTMLTTEDIIQDNKSSYFNLADGEILSRVDNDIIYYYCKNVTLKSIRDNYALVQNLNGNFSYNPNRDSFTASFSALFPAVNNDFHNVKITTIFNDGETEYFLVSLDERLLKIDKKSIYMMMLGGFEFAIEYILH